METQSSQQSPVAEKPNQNYIMPSQLGEAMGNMASLTKILVEMPNSLNTMRRKFRGEALWQSEDGTNHWVQISKPTFVKVDIQTAKPIVETKKMPWGEDKKIYIPNDEAIDEILSMLDFMGVNQIAPVGFNQYDNYMDDLREFECKLAAVLALKQKEWGLDKELLPMIQTKIKTMVQDVRGLAVNGVIIKALQTTVQRVEQLIEGDKNIRRLAASSPYG